MLLPPAPPPAILDVDQDNTNWIQFSEPNTVVHVNVEKMWAAAVHYT